MIALILPTAVAAAEPEGQPVQPTAPESGTTQTTPPETTPAPSGSTEVPATETPPEPPPLAAPQTPMPTTEQPPAEPPAKELAAPAIPITAGWEKGFFIRSEDKKYEFRPTAMLQTRLSLSSTLVKEKSNDYGAAFSIPRARAGMQGSAFSPKLRYKLETDFGKGFVSLTEFFVDYAFYNLLHVRAGQMKRPFSRQQINSSSKMQFVDLAITDKAFGSGRDIGVTLGSEIDKSPIFEWSVGVFNGTGDAPTFSGTVTTDKKPVVKGGKFSNVPVKLQPAVVGRTGFNLNGINSYSEADLERKTWGVAGGASMLARFDAASHGASEVQGEVDGMFKSMGFSATGALYVALKEEHTAFSAAWPQPDWDLKEPTVAVGGHVQAGYVIMKLVEPAARYAFVVTGRDQHQHELLGGLNLYFFGHQFKWQTDAGPQFTWDKGTWTWSPAVRTQLQFAM